MIWLHATDGNLVRLRPIYLSIVDNVRTRSLGFGETFQKLLEWKVMKTVGEILKTEREVKNLSLDEVAAATKIKKEFLEAIENGVFRKITSEVTLRGFIKNYAEFLGLSSKAVLAVFKRDFIQEKKATTIVSRPGFHWTPQLTLILAVAIFVLLLAAYLARQYLSLVNTPY